MARTTTLQTARRVPCCTTSLPFSGSYGSGAARTGDTTYGFNSNTARSFNGFALDPYDLKSSFFATSISPQFAIWDTGGIDTIDASLWPEEN